MSHTTQQWCLYMHSDSTCDTYGASYTLVSKMNSLEDWAQVWNHCHPEVIGDPTRALILNGKVVTSWSLFRDDITPEWEHKENAHGATLTHRSKVSERSASIIYADLVMECIRGAEPDYINGIQVTCKHFRSNTSIKFDVWLSCHTNVHAAAEWLLAITSLQFSVSKRESFPGPL